MGNGLARANGKGLVIGEDWLYKGRDGDLGGNGVNYVELSAGRTLSPPRA